LLDFPLVTNKIHTILIEQHSSKAIKLYKEAIEMMDDEDKLNQQDVPLCENSETPKLSTIGFPAYHPFRLDTALCFACFYHQT